MIRAIALVVLSILAPFVVARALLSWRAERRRVRAIRDAQREADSRDSLRLSRERAGLELEAAARDSARFSQAVESKVTPSGARETTWSTLSGVDLGAKDSEGTLYARVMYTGEVLVQRDDGTWEPAEGCPGTFRAFSDEVSPPATKWIEPQPITIDRTETIDWAARRRTVVDTRVYEHDVGPSR